MTREHKLALIIGFSLVLLIGVLISDHFSRAAELDMAGVTEKDASAAPLVQPVSRESLGPVLDRDNAAAQAASSGPGEPGTVASSSSTQGAVHGESEPTKGSDWPDPRQFVDASNPPVPAANLQLDIGKLRKKVRESGWLDAPGSDTATAPDASSGTGETPVQPQPEPVKPAFADHTVKPGESLFEIAARHLGDGNRWRAIRDANPKSVGSDGSVRAGVRLRIPLAGESQTTAIRDPLNTPVPKAQPKEQSKPPAKPSTPARPPTYTVRKGESLGEIAIRTLGTSRRANEIAVLNGLKDANMVRVGMVLKIPQG